MPKTKEVLKNDESIDSFNEEVIEVGLRPKTIDGFIGQKLLKDNLKVFTGSAKAQNVQLDHVLLYGPPGLGKTTLSGIIASDMGVGFHTTAGPILSKTGDLAAILTNLKEGDVFFIDEVHRMPIAVEEMLYSAMEDFKLDIIVGEGPAARSIRIELPKFTLIGATTRMGLLSNPLRGRFGILLGLDFYNLEELCEVVIRFANKMQIKIDKKAGLLIASMSRGTPRIALRVAKRVIDFAIVGQKNYIDEDIVDYASKSMKIDKLGLDKEDIAYLSFIVNKCNGGPVGIETISSALFEDKRSIEEVIEPFLIKEGFIVKTQRGRNATQKAIKHIGLNN